jgi:DNA-binding Lrp family transcriptional regulator
MLTGGYIKIHRKIVDWEWYHDPVVSRVFLHLLVTANYESGRFEGHKIEVGQCVISLQKVAEILNISKDSVNRALKKLEKSGELQRLPTAKFTIITLKNYPYYQQSATEADRLPTESRPQADPMEEIKKLRNKEVKKEEGGASAPASPSPQITFDSLILEFGKSNVDAYVTKVRNWMRRKGIKGEPTAELVGKWLNEDRASLKLPGDDKSNIAVSFSVDELEKSSYARYRKDKDGKK